MVTEKGKSLSFPSTKHTFSIVENGNKMLTYSCFFASAWVGVPIGGTVPPGEYVLASFCDEVVMETSVPTLRTLTLTWSALVVGRVTLIAVRVLTALWLLWALFTLLLSELWDIVHVVMVSKSKRWSPWKKIIPHHELTSKWRSVADVCGVSRYLSCCTPF